MIDDGRSIILADRKIGRTIRKLEVEEVKRCAREAYDNGKLLAQNRETNKDYLYRSEDGLCCAIGAALSHDESLRLIQHSTINNAINRRILDEKSYSATEWLELKLIQEGHDIWSNAENKRLGRYSTEKSKIMRKKNAAKRKREFLNLINHPKA